MGSGASRGSKPTLYIFPMSAPCRALLLAAKTANVQYDIHTVDLMKGEHKGDDFLKINPEHTVPALVDKQFKLWESRAIMTYLVDTYAPGHHLYPKDNAKRAEINRLLFRDISFVAQHVNGFLYPQLYQHQPADPEKQAEVEKVFEYLETLLEDGRHYLTGEQATLADISIEASISSLELNDWQFSRWTKVDEWRHRLATMPHYEEVNKPLHEFKQMIKSSAS